MGRPSTYSKNRFLFGGYSLSQEYAWKKRRDELAERMEKKRI